MWGPSFGAQSVENPPIVPRAADQRFPLRDEFGQPGPQAHRDDLPGRLLFLPRRQKRQCGAIRSCGFNLKKQAPANQMDEIQSEQDCATQPEGECLDLSKMDQGQSLGLSRNQQQIPPRTGATRKLHLLKIPDSARACCCKVPRQSSGNNSARLFLRFLRAEV
jgi:hypothetical protein